MKLILLILSIIAFVLGAIPALGMFQLCVCVGLALLAGAQAVN